MPREPVARLHPGRGRPARHAAQGGGGAGATDDRAGTAGDRQAHAPPAAGPGLASIAAKERRMAALTDEELRDRTAALRARLSGKAKAQG